MLGSPPGPAHGSRRRHTSAATVSLRLLLALRYLQRGRSIPSTPRGCCECTASLSLVTLTFDLWRWHSNLSERRTKHVFHVNLAQIRSAVPVIHCRMRVSRIERVSTTSRIWRKNGRQTITVNFTMFSVLFNMELRLKWNKIVLAAKQFYFISDVVPCKNKILKHFKTLKHLKFFKIILF